MIHTVTVGPFYVDPAESSITVGLQLMVCTIANDTRLFLWMTEAFQIELCVVIFTDQFTVIW